MQRCTRPVQVQRTRGAVNGRFDPGRADSGKSPASLQSKSPDGVLSPVPRRVLRRIRTMRSGRSSTRPPSSFNTRGHRRTRECLAAPTAWPNQAVCRARVADGVPTTGSDSGVRGIDAADPGSRCWTQSTDMNLVQIPARRMLNMSPVRRIAPASLRSLWTGSVSTATAPSAQRARLGPGFALGRSAREGCSRCATCSSKR